MNENIFPEDFSHEAPIVRIMPDGEIVIHSVTMGELSIKTQDGETTLIIEATAREDYNRIIKEKRGSILQQELDKLEAQFSKPVKK